MSLVDISWEVVKTAFPKILGSIIAPPVLDFFKSHTNKTNLKVSLVFKKEKGMSVNNITVHLGYNIRVFIKNECEHDALLKEIRIGDKVLDTGVKIPPFKTHEFFVQDIRLILELENLVVIDSKGKKLRADFTEARTVHRELLKVLMLQHEADKNFKHRMLELNHSDLIFEIATQVKWDKIANRSV